MNRLRLLGPPLLETPSAAFTPDRRMAGVLAYLALEGSTHKYKLAGLLWPDTEETTARNNMRQLLRRVRTGGGDIITGEDLIELRPEVGVDVKQLSYLEAPSLELLKQDVELLAGLEYDDTYDFADWLTGAREELRDLRARSAKAEAERLERAGQYKQALEYAQVWARLEPLSEEAQRQVIRLQYLLGDRGAALATFERLNQLLDEQLGTTPLPETIELARMIERGGELAGAKPKPRENLLPTSILRPPVLAGREREWALLEDAWERGQVIYLEGEPGVGKTRLALDFAQSKGKVFHFRARPGDAGIPLATQARAIREMLEQDPKMLERMPQWARCELARLLPELNEGEALPPLSPQADKLRFFEAVSEAVLAREPVITVADDVQFADPVTIESTGYVMNKFVSRARSDKPRIINVFRRGELSPEIEASLNQGIELGLLAKISLEPLEPGAIGLLLEGLGLSHGGNLVQGLSRYTGGNPMFILETLKHLIETDTLSEGLPSRLAPPGKVVALVGRRLQRLSPGALNLARAAAVAKASFDLGLAAAVLERPPMELAEAHAELEAAQVLRGNAFTHDLVFEAVLSGIPTAVGQVLHHRTAQYLETAKAAPALVAQHWEAAGESEQAARWLLRAADEARGLGLFDEAVRLYGQVGELSTDPALRLEAQAGLTYPLVAMGRLEQAETLARAVLAGAADPRTRVKALDALQTALMWHSRHAEAEAAIAEAQRLAEGLGDEALADEMRFSHGFILSRLGRDAEAAEILEPLLPRYRVRAMGFERLHLLSVLGGVYADLGRFDQAKPLLHEALAGAKGIGSAINQIAAANDLQYTHNAEGTPEEGLPHALEALALGEYVITELLRAKLAHAYLLLGRDAEAVEQLEWLTAKAQDPNTLSAAWARLATAQTRQGLDHRTALAEAVKLYGRSEVPMARLVVAGAALEYGDEGQRAWAREMLAGLDPGLLSPQQRAEYDRLRGLEARGERSA